MAGFLHLVEGFLAFALTMLALSTAVSAIVEVGYNLTRWRARGLRDMAAYLYQDYLLLNHGDALAPTIRSEGTGEASELIKYIGNGMLTAPTLSDLKEGRLFEGTLTDPEKSAIDGALTRYRASQASASQKALREILAKYTLNRKGQAVLIAAEANKRKARFIVETTMSPNTGSLPAGETSPQAVLVEQVAKVLRSPLKSAETTASQARESDQRSRLGWLFWFVEGCLIIIASIIAGIKFGVVPGALWPGLLAAGVLIVLYGGIVFSLSSQRNAMRGRPWVIWGGLALLLLSAFWFPDEGGLASVATCLWILSVLVVLACRDDVSLIAYLARGTQRWSSLEFAMTKLPEDEFLIRFEKSEVGQSLKTQSSTWETILENVRQQYQWLAVAATDRFLKTSRYYAIAVGFILAFAVNIDSFNLLNTYLTDPQVRSAVIANADRYIEAANATEVQNLAADTLSSNGVKKGNEAAGTTKTKADSLIHSINSLLGSLDGIAGLSPPDTLKLDSLRTQARQMIAASQEASREFTAAIGEVNAITTGLTESFPIGWTRYPRCPKGTADVRCGVDAERGDSLKKEIERRKLESSQPTFSLSGEGIIAAPAYPFRVVAWGVSYMGAFRAADPRGFTTWLFGVLATGLLVGLGSPFWVGVVQKLLSLREGAKQAEKQIKEIKEQAKVQKDELQRELELAKAEIRREKES